MAYETVTGYCWPQSATAGDEVALHLSSAGGRPVQVEVARVGAERDVVWHDEVPADDHPLPHDAWRDGCDWPAAVTVPIEPSWRSGYYEVQLDIDVDGKRRRSHAFFVVRPRTGAPTARILLALATDTWHAYNETGGGNLYTGRTQVSLQRPLAPGLLFKPPGPGRRVTVVHAPDRQMVTHVGYLTLNHLTPWAGSAGWPDWEHPFLAWAEREGYAVDVVTNADLEDHPALLAGDPTADDHTGYRLLLSVGHDEYWSSPMRDTVEDFIARGGNVAFFSGNTSFWQVRFEDHTPEGPAATMVGYKGQLKRDPVYGTDRVGELTSMWSDHLIGRPENHMTGVSFARGGYHRIGKVVSNGAGGYTVHRPEHWIFEGTGIGYGDLLGAGSTVVGYECDGCDFTYVDGRPEPTGIDGTPATFQILGTAPAAHFTHETATRPPAPGEPSELEGVASRVFGSRDPEHVERVRYGHAVLGTWTSEAGGTVVTSGSTDWAHGLAGHDDQIIRITRNVLDRLGAPPA
ncbi:MAG: DUF6605 domain-containing protein [Acidimicrobiales bacterium]